MEEFQRKHVTIVRKGRLIPYFEQKIEDLGTFR